MLGIHISVAVAWQRASSGDWTTYARRSQPPDSPPRQAFRQLEYLTSPEHLSNSDPEDVLQQVWVAGPGTANPGEVLTSDASPMTREQAQALAIDLSRRSTPAEGGFCTFQPVVDGGACPWNLDCHNCDKFVLSGADLLYWRRKREQWRQLAEGRSQRRRRVAVRVQLGQPTMGTAHIASVGIHQPPRHTATRTPDHRPDLRNNQTLDCADITLLVDLCHLPANCQTERCTSRC
jgi:hypothetical protein